MTWCLNCTEDFHDDDTGGYNPSCKHGWHCRSCCDAGCCDRYEPIEDTPDWQDAHDTPPSAVSGSQENTTE
jgi:hypothetical protein